MGSAGSKGAGVPVTLSKMDDKTTDNNEKITSATKTMPIKDCMVGISPCSVNRAARCNQTDTSRAYFSRSPASGTRAYSKT